MMRNLLEGLIDSLTSAVIKPAIAAPLWRKLEDILESSSTVFQAQYVGFNRENRYVRFDVQRVLRGSFTLGEYNFPYVPHQTPHPRIWNLSTSCIVFLNQHEQLQYVAIPFTFDADKPLEQALLKILGFYDFNAHVISTNYITLAQIENYYRTRELIYLFEGQLYFFDKSEDRIAASEVYVSAIYNYFSKSSTVTSSSEFLNFLKVERLGGFEFRRCSQIVLGHDDSAPKLLNLEGECIGVNSETGAIQTKFWTRNPELYTEEHFQQYIANPSLGFPFYKISVIHQDQTRWMISMGEQPDQNTLIGFRNKVFQLRLGITIDDSSRSQMTRIRIKIDEAIDKAFLQRRSPIPPSFHDSMEVPLDDQGLLLFSIDSTGIKPLFPARESFQRAMYLRSIDFSLIESLLQNPVLAVYRVRGGRSLIPPTLCVLELESIEFGTASDAVYASELEYLARSAEYKRSR